MSNYQVLKAIEAKYYALNILEQSENSQEVELAIRLLDAIQAKLNKRSN